MILNWKEANLSDIHFRCLASLVSRASVLLRWLGWVGDNGDTGTGEGRKVEIGRRRETWLSEDHPWIISSLSPWPKKMVACGHLVNLIWGARACSGILHPEIGLCWVSASCSTTWTLAPVSACCAPDRKSHFFSPYLIRRLGKQKYQNHILKYKYTIPLAPISAYPAPDRKWPLFLSHLEIEKSCNGNCPSITIDKLLHSERGEEAWQ